MKEIHFHDTRFIEQLVNVFLSDFPVAIFEFSGVYGLISCHSKKGCYALNKTKNRLSGKYYGSFLGNEDSFFTLIEKENVILRKEILSDFEGSILRVPIIGKGSENEVIHNGTHQFLVERREVRSIMKTIEEAMMLHFSESDFYEYNYQAPLCTSANESGDASGGIQNLNDALAFGNEKNIPLFIHTGLHNDLSGSYPVFSIENENIQLVRKGPRDQQISERIQAKLR